MKNPKYKTDWREANPLTKDQKKEINRKQRESYSKRSKKWYKEYASKNKEYIAKRKKEYNLKNKQLIKSYKSEYYVKNKQLLKKQHKQWLENNSEYRYLYQKNRIATDNLFAFKTRCRNLTRWSFNCKGFKKETQTEKLLGISIDMFFKWIEMQFAPGMSWNNRNLWHLDHIIALKSAKTEQEIKDLCVFTNIRPIWAKENLEKSSKCLNKNQINVIRKKQKQVAGLIGVKI